MSSMKRILKVVETVVDVFQAAKSLTDAAGAERGGYRDHYPASPPSEHR